MPQGQPRAPGWTPKGNIKGPKGDTGAAGSTGAQGPAGTPGEVWWSGAGVPAGTLGAVGDWYINTSTSDVYEKTGSTVWTLKLNIKGNTGATGSQGPQGIQGPIGNTGPQGATGNTGPQGAQGPAGQGVPTGGTAGQRLTKNSATNYDAVWNDLATLLGITPTTPAGTTSTTGVMMGLNEQLTLVAPTSGKVLAIICGYMSNNTAGAGNGAKVQIRYGTGTPPINGAALVGTAIGNVVAFFVGSATTMTVPFSIQAIITGLTPGTAYWFDLMLAALTAGTASIINPTMSIIEL